MNAKKHQKIELRAEKRVVVGRKVAHLRNEGIVPAVLYGKDQEALNIQVPMKDFTRVLRDAGESTLVYLSVDGTEYPTIIHDVASDAVSGGYLHADFYKVNLKEKIKAMVPVVFTGESPAVKNFAGILVRNINELEVEALPSNLPHEITIDISLLKNLNDQVMVRDLKLGADVALMAEGDEIIATVQEPISEEALKASLEAPTTSVEDVEEIKKEKTEKDVAEEEAPAASAGTAEPEQASKE